MKQGYKIAALIGLVLLIDQASKFYIKTHFCYNEDITMFGAQWARLHFVENEGMAFGITFDWVYGKLVLSLFRILMVVGLIWYIRLLMAAKAPTGFIYSIGFITAGALGNILDSTFYGLIFSESLHHDCIPAQLVPFGQGYGTFLHGKVVDMLYFPMKWISMPSWVPLIGGEEFLFFSPIFNVADAAITTGVLCILLFQRRFFKQSFAQEVAEETEIAKEELDQDFLPEGEAPPSDMVADVENPTSPELGGSEQPSGSKED